jgi:DNA mismatch repair protein MutL
MATIRVLPTSLINKIAAGEVIERPASVVKEMLENSIDAGATKIEITVEGGGIDLIRIADNGCGIAKDELVLAVSPHATSKLVDPDDLFEIYTLGFRGEALASVAEISHLTLRSRHEDSDSGAELVIRGGEMSGPIDCSSPVGTTIEVRNLFFNTPVRKKFLKSPQTEMGHTIEAFTRIALAYPQVHMVLISNQRTLHNLPATQRIADRIEAFFGPEIADNLFSIDSSERGIRLRGFVVDPAVSRSNNRMQYLFLNGRFIRDRSLQHALGEAYRGLLMVGRFPICFLHLDIPANQVDVNVHPTKSEVRFLDGGEIYKRLLQTLRSRFLKSDLTLKVGQGTPLEDVAHGSPAAWPPHFAQTHHGMPLGVNLTPRLDPEQRYRDESPVRGIDRDGDGYGHSVVARSFETPTPRSSDSTIPPFRPFEVGSRSAFSHLGPSTSQQPSETFGTTHTAAASPLSFDTFEVEPGDRSSSQSAGSHLPEIDKSASARVIGFQFHDRYLITEDDAGLAIIDQHALHERILYEQIRERVLGQTMESQRLLIPEPVSLTASEAAMVLEHKDLLAQMGLEVDAFGGDTVLVSSYPAMLKNVSPSEMLKSLIEPLIQAGKEPELRDLLDSLMHSMSCKGAIKAGDKLSDHEITELLSQRECYRDTHHCPHGRPTALFFSKEQLDKMFKRT